MIFVASYKDDNQGIVYPPSKGDVVHPLKLFTPPTPSPLEVLRVLTRTLIGSMLFSAIGGYYCLAALFGLNALFVN